MPRGKLSARTRKQIDELPVHAQHIYVKARDNALKHYRNPEKRRGGSKVSSEEVANKVAWAAVKRKYEKAGGEWKPK